MVTIIKDIDLINDIEKYDVILVGTNIYHTMGNGFQRKIRRKYPETYKMNLSTKYGDLNKMGTIMYSKDSHPTFVLCFINEGYNFRPDLAPVFLDYDSLEKCISLVNSKFVGLNIATTFIGCSKFDGNGDKNIVVKLLNDICTDINLHVYDYEQIPRDVENAIKYSNAIKNECIEEKSDAIKKMREEEKSLYSISDNPNKRLSKIKNEIKLLLNNKDKKIKK